MGSNPVEALIFFFFFFFWQDSLLLLPANNIFLDLVLLFVVARTTHVALPCELTEKLIETTVRA